VHGYNSFRHQETYDDAFVIVNVSA